MEINQAIKLVNSKFVYTSDSNSLPFDEWRVMDEDAQDKLRGDCEDYSLTVLWYVCDRSWWKFLWYVILTHQYRIYHVKTHTGGRHAVGRIGDLWFDNWTKEALPYKEFFNRTNHEHKYFYFMPIMFIPFIVGHLTRAKAN